LVIKAALSKSIKVSAIMKCAFNAFWGEVFGGDSGVTVRSLLRGEDGGDELLTMLGACIGGASICDGVHGDLRGVAGGTDDVEHGGDGRRDQRGGFRGGSDRVGDSRTRGGDG